MHGEKPDAERRDSRGSMSDRFRNIMKLEIEKNTAAADLVLQLLQQPLPLFDEQRKTDLEKPDPIFQLPDRRLRFIKRADIERQHDSIFGREVYRQRLLQIEGWKEG